MKKGLRKFGLKELKALEWVLISERSASAKFDSMKDFNKKSKELEAVRNEIKRKEG